MFNIPVDINQLPANAGNLMLNLAPEKSIQSNTDFGEPGFGGACPPIGNKLHRYQFTVYALDTEDLALDANVNPATVGFYLQQHTLNKATLEAYYSR
jgi:Raf kinase inhibitor-like YbhB/YbcL family protein